ncbi:hypothetical protein HGO38_15750 [Rhizobium sp. CG5]|uniref:hypothetical protein n=1 Tax=Rhizobium sp. CG5 TaxID=2726076 RepID=UPI002034009B|nr:hypothetical protein [Rhizobium sp. CG5]MCM2474936.1 hypothetical protein [Rhizobium sp. CG5]
MRAVNTVWSGMLRTLCAVALLSLAFAHKPPQVMAAAFETVSLQLPDGSYADLCISEAGTKHPLINQFCEACMLSSTALLPTPDPNGWLLSSFASLQNSAATASEIPVALAVDHPRSRGPPSIS